MNQSLNLKAGVFAFIAAIHAGALALALVFLSRSASPPSLPPPLVMAQIIPMVQPQVEAPPQPQPKPQPKPEPKPKQEPQKKPPKPQVQPKREIPRTVESETALSAPKPEPAPPQPAPVPAPAPPAPPAPAPQPAPPPPITPPQHNASYLNNPAPVYPRLLQRAGEEGSVLLRVLVTAEGTAGQIQVKRPSSSPLFDEAAVAAVRKWRFVPARRGDTPVAEWYEVPIVFKLN